MKELDKPTFGPQIEEPTAEAIEHTMTEAKQRYGIELPRTEAIRFTKLTQELGWWLLIEGQLNNSGNVTEAIAQEVQAFIGKHHGRKITLEEAAQEARRSSQAIAGEKERIGREIRTIIDRARE